MYTGPHFSAHHFFPRLTWKRPVLRTVTLTRDVGAYMRQPPNTERTTWKDFCGKYELLSCLWVEVKRKTWWLWKERSNRRFQRTRRIPRRFPPLFPCCRGARYHLAAGFFFVFPPWKSKNRKSKIAQETKRKLFLKKRRTKRKI